MSSSRGQGTRADWGWGEPFVQLGPAPTPRNVLHRDGDSLLLSDQHDQPLAAGDAGIKQVPLQHGVMLGEDGDHDCRIFGALTLVNGRRIGRHQGIEFAKAVGDGAAIEAGNQLAGIRVDIVDVADVAIIDLVRPKNRNDRQISQLGGVG